MPALSGSLPATAQSNLDQASPGAGFPSLGAQPVAASGINDAGAVITAGYSVTGPRSFREISLNEAVSLAMQNSTVIRDLGGRLISQPGFASSNLNPVLVGSDPRGGVEAALSAFDAQLLASFNGRKNNRGLQQFVPLSSNTQISQYQSDFLLGARRTYTTGTVVGLSHFTNYRRDGFGCATESILERVHHGARWRHPSPSRSGQWSRL